MDGDKHYIRLDANNFVVKGFSDAFEEPLPSDKLVATTSERHFNPVLTDGQGNLIFKWDGTQMVDRTQDADYLLTTAKQKKLAELQAGFAGATANGFTSTADTTSRTYGLSDTDSKHWEWIRGMVNAGTCPASLQVKDIAGNTVNLTPTTAATLCTDAQNFFLSNWNNWNTKSGNLKAAMDVPSVNAIVW